ncbi:photosystem II protein PsbQ [Geitlerinema sp. CS-897]|uniref:photosystem II protein PsbQ n=1 Tax=Baaleninema simplex TaxID=2862350 RepID=UPI0005538DC1|nr:photosystem II protein PsbQ [Baaleninema simplex]MDC0832009.1 photosystem II protein PsbQ [Geitlerinema sp. CS-897]
MSRYRSILAGLLVCVAVFLVSCGGPATVEAPTYTPETLERIQSYSTEVTELRDRMGELEDLIDARDWVDVDNFIHGPLGTLRQDMSLINRNLLPDEQRQGRDLARNLFRHLEEINLAAKERDYAQAVQNYRESLADFDAFLDILPKSNTAS